MIYYSGGINATLESSLFALINSVVYPPLLPSKLGNIVLPFNIHSKHRTHMLANVRFGKSSCELRSRQQYKSRADEVVLSRSHKNRITAGLKCNTPQSDESIFDMLNACLEK